MPTEEKRGGWSSQTPSTHWSGWYFERLGLPKIPFHICILMVRFAKLGQNTGGNIQRQLVENVPGRMVRRFDNISFYDLLPKKLCCRCHWQMKSSAWCWCSPPNPTLLASSTLPTIQTYWRRRWSWPWRTRNLPWWPPSISYNAVTRTKCWLISP